MRTRLELDDALVGRAMSLTGHVDIAKIVQEPLTAFVQGESARRLALRGGTEPEFGLPRRRRPELPSAE